jgi:glycerate kinase
MKVVIATDSFKGSASAGDLSLWIKEGWLSQRPNDEVICLPMADGGEGSRAVIEASARNLEGVAVIELAEICGITKYSPLDPLDPLDPLGAHTYELGVAIRKAIESGVERIILCVGGSASTDAGTGALRALGAKFLDKSGNEIPLGGAGLLQLDSIDLTGLIAGPLEGITIFSDVTNPLTGKNGSARIFGPQKGATAEQVELLDEALFNLVRVSGFPETSGSGAAGGTTYGFQLAYDADVKSGSAEIAKLIGLPEAIASADLVITGEGRYDSQSLQGKVVSAVAALAGQTPVAYIVGVQRIDFPPGSNGISLTELAGSSAAAIADVQDWATKAGALLTQSIL